VSKSPVDRFPFAKIVIILAVAFLVGLGLCGIDYVLAANGIGKSTEEFGVGILDGPSLVIMCLSAVCLIFTLILWAIAGIVSNFAPSDGNKDTTNPLSPAEKVSQPERRPRDADDTNIDKQE
jgi:hypothetical protein